MPYLHSFIKSIAILSILIVINKNLTAQRVFVNNTVTGIFELTGGPGSCTKTHIINECGDTIHPFSTALYKDTLYYIRDNGWLYSFKIGVPGSCHKYLNVGITNSLTVDRNGILYMDNGDLYRFNPYTNQFTDLGTHSTFTSSGDLIFYHDKLLLAGWPAGIYEININNPDASSLYMNTGNLIFWGLLSYPVQCGNSRFFGVAEPDHIYGTTTMYELDLETRVVIGSSCTLAAIETNDACSSTELGLNAGINVLGLEIYAACVPSVTGGIHINAIYPGFNITYTLDNATVNTTGIFDNVPFGSHHISMNAGNCVLDTTVVIVAEQGPSIISVQTSNPPICNGSNATIAIDIQSGTMPITYTDQLSGLQQVNNGDFIDVLPGTHHFVITDVLGCSTDTSITLVQPLFLPAVTTSAAHCNLSNGSISVDIPGGNTTAVLTSLGAAGFLPQLTYNNLLPGVYHIKIKNGFCIHDTTVTVINVIDPHPQISLQKTDQLCNTNNGSITVTAFSPGYSYQYQVNGNGFSGTTTYTSLAAGFYHIIIRDQYGCLWDTSVFILHTVNPRPTIVIQKTDPSCSSNSGSFTVTASAPGYTYIYQVDGNGFSSTTTYTSIVVGLHYINIRDQDGCQYDTTVAIQHIMNPMPTIVIQKTNQSCTSNNGSFTITASLPGYTYQYQVNGNGFSGTTSYASLAAGLYSINIQDQYGCQWDTSVTIQHVVNPPPAIVIQKTDQLCTTNNGSFSITAFAPGFTYQYQVNGNGFSGTTTYISLAAGTYQIDIRDQDGCQWDTSVSIQHNINPRPTIAVQKTGQLCTSDNGSFTITASASGSNYQYQVNGNGFSGTNTFTSLAAGLYQIDIRDQYGCQWDTSVSIQHLVNPRPAIVLQKTDQLCLEDNGSFSIIASGPGPTYEYQFNGNGFSNTNIFSGIAPGTYNVDIRDQAGCQWDTSVLILPYIHGASSVIINTTDPICREERKGSIQVNVNGVDGPYTITINNNSYTNNQLLSNLQEGVYHITVYNKDGCVIDSTTRALSIKYDAGCNIVFIPSAFTPNEDGTNDLFGPLYSFFIKDITLDVYNRYGEKIFHGTGHSAKWDGRFKGQAQSIGAYIYMVTYKDHYGALKKLKGSFSLIR